MKTISFSSLKGGTGKSSLCILMANYAAAAGYRVLAIDLDPQCSLTYHYLEDSALATHKNVLAALYREKVDDNLLATKYPGVDLLASSVNLTKIRSLNERTLGRVLPQVSDNYDFCFIDTGPAYDNLVMNAVVASDLILCPVKLSQFDLITAFVFWNNMKRDTDKASDLRLVLNFHRAGGSDITSRLREVYESAFRDNFGTVIAPTEVPETSFVRRAIEIKEPITKAGEKFRLHAAIGELARYCGVERTAAKF